MLCMGTHITMHLQVYNKVSQTEDTSTRRQQKHVPYLRCGTTHRRGLLCLGVQLVQHTMAGCDEEGGAVGTGDVACSHEALRRNIGSDSKHTH